MVWSIYSLPASLSTIASDSWNRKPMWSSAAVAHSPQGLKCCVMLFSPPRLNSRCLCYCNLPVGSILVPLFNKCFQLQNMA